MDKKAAKAAAKAEAKAKKEADKAAKKAEKERVAAEKKAAKEAKKKGTSPPSTESPPASPPPAESPAKTPASPAKEASPTPQKTPPAVETAPQATTPEPEPSKTADTDTGSRNPTEEPAPKGEPAQKEEPVSIEPPVTFNGTPLWKKVAEWLTKMGVLPDLNKAFGEGSSLAGKQPTAMDLLLFLHDGTSLCELVNVLQPEKITSFHDHPVENFKQTANISKYQDAILELGLSDQGFESDDLRLGQNFGAVLSSLADVSKLDVSQKVTAAISPENFVTEEKTGVYTDLEEKFQAILDADAEEEVNIYNLEANGPTLYELATTAGHIGADDHASNGISLYELARQENLEIHNYDDDDDGSDESSLQKSKGNNWNKVAQLVKDNMIADGEENSESTNDLYSAEVYEALFISNEPSLYTSEDTSSHRGHALAELIDTEKKYLDVLNVLLDVYDAGLRKHPEISSDNDRKILFSNVAELRGIHRAFLKLLEVQMKSKTGRMLGHAFINSIECFRAYGEFCCLMPAAFAKYEELMTKSPESTALMVKLKEESKVLFTLRTLLNVPMQRVLKYPLLLKEIRKGTPSSHSDKENLDEAMLQIQGLAKLVNETMRTYENVESIAANLKGYSQSKPLTSYYTFSKFRMAALLDTDLAFKKEESKDKILKLYCFLLPSAIMLCEVKKAVYTFKELIVLDTESQSDSISDGGTPKASQTGKYKEGLKVTSKGSTYLLVFSSAAGKSQWQMAISNNIQALKETATKPPPMVPEPKKLPKPKKAPSGSPRASFANNMETDDTEEMYKLAMPEPETPKKNEHPLKKYPWYVGVLGGAGAAKRLAGKPDSTYLVRESDKRPGEYVLAVIYGNKAVHIPIKNDDDKFFTDPSIKFDDILTLVQHYRNNEVAEQCKTKLKLAIGEAR